MGGSDADVFAAPVVPVVEVGDRRLTLAISPRGLQRFLDDVLGPVLAS